MSFVLTDATEKPSPPANGDVITAWRQEIDSFYGVIRQFNSYDSVEVMRNLSAMSARASEMRTRLVRTDNRRAVTFRTKEIDPFLEEVDRQFKIHSRIVAIQQQEWEISRGGM